MNSELFENGASDTEQKHCREGLIHIYCGDGKGKTTAACGLAVRAAGSGMKVLFVQFFKNGGSSEISVLRTIPNVETLHSQTCFARFVNLSDEGKRDASKCYSELLEEAIRRSSGVDLLILDEIVSACVHGSVDTKRLLGFLKDKPVSLEVVLTGRNPPPELVGLADYVSEIRKVKHPFDDGIAARRGIEF